MKNKNKSILTTFSIFAILVTQGCYTRLATTRTVYVEPVQEKYVTPADRYGTPENFDSLYVEEEVSTVVVKEYYYWAYKPWFDYPAYSYPGFSISYYSGYPHNGWFYDYGYNYPPWNWHGPANYYYDPYYWGHYHHHHHHGYPWYYGGGHKSWYTNKYEPPRKKRNWERRGTSRGDELIVRNSTTGTYSEGVAVGSKTAGSDNNSTSNRIVERAVKLERTVNENSTRTIKRSSVKDKPSKEYVSKTSDQLIRAIARNTEKTGDSKSKNSNNRSASSRKSAARTNSSKAVRSSSDSKSSSSKSKSSSRRTSSSSSTRSKDKKSDSSSRSRR